jgi:ankyrin repeat protein
MQVETISANSATLTELQRQLLENTNSGLEVQHGIYSASLVAMQQRVEERIGRLEGMIQAQELRTHESQAHQLCPYHGVVAQKRRRRSAAEEARQRQLSPRADAVGIRLTRYATTCRSGCPCVCHRHKKSSTPAILDRIVGQLFIGYSGVPGLSPKCNDESCENSQTPRIDLEYWFPLDFFWSQIVRLQIGYERNVGPQLQLSTLRRVSDNTQSVEFAMGGNIDGLKDLFKRGLASPRDVSSTRGYSLLRWALYGKQYETCQFLLHAGGDTEYRPISPFDQSPMEKAHDYLLQGRFAKSEEGALRELTRGSDFVDEQNFTLLHKSVLGLSISSLEDAILQHPDDIDTKDALGRTPLSWAALRGDDRAIALLLAHGADPNAVGIRDCPLSNAAGRGCTKGCRLLLEAGANPDLNELSGYKTGSPLNVAARNSNDPLCFKTILDFGANTECCGVDGRTPLIHVARTNNVRFALLLLEYGADVNATSATGHTPLTTAIMHNGHDVLRLLLERWSEYSECPRLKGGHLLKLSAEFADLETILILTATNHVSTI